MKFEKTEVMGFEGAFRGLRNPKNSWDRADSVFEKLIPKKEIKKYSKEYPINFIANTSVKDVVSFLGIGPNDLKLAQQLIGAGPEHCKFLRQIFVSVDITAPLYWWKEFDTYKVGTTANSTSTMHKVMSKPITRESFETDDLNDDTVIFHNASQSYINEKKCFTPVFAGWYIDKRAAELEAMRQYYLELKKSKQDDESKLVWKELIRNLPESWLQTRTVTMSYANLRNIYFQREFHKLTEWRVAFCNWVKTLPFAAELITYEKPHVCKCNKTATLLPEDILKALEGYGVELSEDQKVILLNKGVNSSTGTSFVDMSKKIKLRSGKITDESARTDLGSFDTVAELFEFILKEQMEAYELLITATTSTDEVVLKLITKGMDTKKDFAFFISGSNIADVYEEVIKH